MVGNHLPVLLLVAALVAGVSLVPTSYSDYLPPLQQVRDGGISPEDVQCNEGLVHAVRSNGAHVCVRESTTEKLGWEVFVSEEATAGGTAHNASSSAEFVDDDVGMEVTAPPKPPAPVQAPAEDKPSAETKDGHVSDGTQKDMLYDPRYYIADNKITLQGVENKLPNPAGLWMPVPKEEAEQVLMPRLAAALGDRLILPEVTDYEICMELLRHNCSRLLDEYDPDYLSYYPYDTEKGNSFMAWKYRDNPDLISEIKYRIYDWVPYDEREEFFRSFMERAGFNDAEVRIGDINGIIYGYMAHVYLEFLADHRGPFMQMNFRDWTNEYHENDIPEGLLLPREELERRAHDFAAAHADLWDEEKCELELNGVGGAASSLHVYAGVPIYNVEVGGCDFDDNPWGTPYIQWIVVEATEGEIMFPLMTRFLVDDWIDRIDIPESAKVKHDK